MAKNGRAEVLKAMYRLDDALSAYEAIIAEHPHDPVVRNGCAGVLLVMNRPEDALKLLPEGTPVTRDDWIAWLLRGMAMMRRADWMAAAAIFERGSREVSGYERDRFLSALAAMRLRQGHYDIADREIAQVQAPSLQPTVNVLRLHIAGRLNRREQAIEAWRRLEEAPPHAVCIELGEELRRRYVEKRAGRYSEDWLFEKTEHCLLQAA